nr:MAG TPA: hypothetical protein [Caudoviricetes sp.]
MQFQNHFELCLAYLSPFLCILCIKSCLFLLSSRILSLQDVAASE